MGLSLVSSFTTNFQLEFLAPGEPAKNTRAVLERMTKSIDAALTRGGVAPPNAQDLVAVAGRTTAVEDRATALENRATALETGAHGRLCRAVVIGGNVGINGQGAAIGTSPAVTLRAGHTVNIDTDCHVYCSGGDTRLWAWIRRIAADNSFVDMGGMSTRVLPPTQDLFRLQINHDDENTPAGVFRYQILACVDNSTVYPVDGAGVKSATRLRRMILTACGPTPPA